MGQMGQMGQVISNYCKLRKNRRRTELCIFLRLLVPEKNLSQASLAMLENSAFTKRAIPLNIGLDLEISDAHTVG